MWPRWQARSSAETGDCEICELDMTINSYILDLELVGGGFIRGRYDTKVLRIEFDYAPICTLQSPYRLELGSFWSHMWWRPSFGVW